MDITQIMNYAVNYYHANQPYVIVVAVLLVFIFYRSPKLGFGVLLVAVILAGVFYFISDLSSMGASSRQKLMDSSMKGPTGDDAAATPEGSDR
ncbi:MAG: hypothetical protein CO150_06450 [Nitrospirae bacterium CG_4_9_14_3_um_filter_53_35]|nr:ABC transporter ATP-binding protein [Deltaproteobacteria bacterium]OIP62164.1 MAG: hypothetical protein AUK29_09005 [Nitrospirae bacterium CG2_30_53_67]PIS38258.1 MAG: hypothetical protein COT35_01865 [Nitrospirae bacterium CG08_land_8_20_14_0_20_52_24]PIV83483.1 MAG: hypothetical protein COW52_08640 [Nitrospirae bacterium CG17_big_fil_post_rev_8_21_14_2_50_50_9]PIX86445.1 MAG: hypothetical protein COZ32_03280 [Nitrospirae bacterium CG_4_10_14_3_um_filter_53_41]PJA74542.1 MAG: hypothetical 